MPIQLITDTGMLAPAITDLYQSLSYIDYAIINSRVPEGYGGFVIANPNLNTINSMTISDIEDTYDLYISDSSVDIVTNVRFSTNIALVLFEYSNDTYSEFPVNVIVREISIEITPPWATITPDPSLQYTEPTEFTIIPPIGYDYAIVLNDAFYFPMFPYSSGINMHDKGFMLSGNTSLKLYKNTKISIFYYSNAYWSYYATIENKSDEFNIAIKEPFSFTIIDYGKLCSFKTPIKAIVKFTDICIIELKTIDLELKLEVINTIEINENLTLELDISSSCVIEIKSISPKELVRKYIFKRELGNKSVYSFYTDDNNILTNNILDANLFDLESSDGGGQAA